MIYRKNFNRKKAIICNFGTGGHTEQMRRLLDHIKCKDLLLIAQSPLKPNDKRYAKYIKISKVRPDYFNFFSIIAIPFSVCYTVLKTVILFNQFDIRLLISTGSGVAIVPSIISKLFGAKVVFFESWSRFYIPSISGRIMYRIADIFFIQNEELKNYYRNAHYLGRL